MRTIQSLASSLSLVSLLLFGKGADATDSISTAPYRSYSNSTSSPYVEPLSIPGTGTAYSVAPSGHPPVVPYAILNVSTIAVVCYSVDCTVPCPTPPSSNSKIHTLPYTRLVTPTKYVDTTTVIITKYVIDICPTGLTTSITTVTRTAIPGRLPLPPGGGGPAVKSFSNSTVAPVSTPPGNPSRVVPLPSGGVSPPVVPLLTGGSASPPIIPLFTGGSVSPPIVLLSTGGSVSSPFIALPSKGSAAPPVTGPEKPAVQPTGTPSARSAETPLSKSYETPPAKSDEIPPAKPTEKPPMTSKEKLTTTTTAKTSAPMTSLYSNAAIAQRSSNGRNCVVEIVLTGLLSIFLV